MKPTDILKQEHRVIEQVLACLHQIVEESEKNRKLDAGSAHQAISFFRNFADRCHHSKEEDKLFPVAERKGVPREKGPIGQMVYEHEIGRNAIRAMDDSIKGAAEGRIESLDSFIRNARDYIHLLRDHIYKEDHCLFPMADEVLDEKDQQALLQSFEELEKEEMGEGTHDLYIEIANRLADHCGVPKVALDLVGCCHGNQRD